MALSGTHVAAHGEAAIAGPGEGAWEQEEGLARQAEGEGIGNGGARGGKRATPRPSHAPGRREGGASAVDGDEWE